MFFERSKLLGVVAGATIAAFTTFHGDIVVAKASKADISAAVSIDKSLQQSARQFYASRKFAPIWVGKKNKARAKALLQAIANADDHGLPADSYRYDDLKTALNSNQGNTSAAGEVLATRIFLKYAHDLSSGILEPRKVDKEIAVQPPRRSEVALLQAIAKSSPGGFFRALVPTHPEYARLFEEKQRLEKLIGRGGYGPKVPVATLKPGTSSKNVVAMRARLSALGYGRLGNDTAFDDNLVSVVQQFQTDHGMKADGVAGPGTLKMMNVSAQQRLQQVLVNMERERWMNRFTRTYRAAVILARTVMRYQPSMMIWCASWSTL